MATGGLVLTRDRHGWSLVDPNQHLDDMGRQVTLTPGQMRQGGGCVLAGPAEADRPNADDYAHAIAVAAQVRRTLRGAFDGEGD